MHALGLERIPICPSRAFPISDVAGCPDFEMRRGSAVEVGRRRAEECVIDDDERTGPMKVIENVPISVAREAWHEGKEQNVQSI